MKEQGENFSEPRFKSARWRAAVVSLASAGYSFCVCVRPFTHKNTSFQCSVFASMEGPSGETEIGSETDETKSKESSDRH